MRLLEPWQGEQPVQAFLEKHPSLIIGAFCEAWNAKYLIPQFELGNEFRCDFLLLSAESCSWHASFIELESAKSRLYLKDGTPSKALRVAQRQIQDWQAFVRRNEQYLREQFAAVLSRRRAPAECSRAGTHVRADTEIRDAWTVIHFAYHIVIGRRHMLSPDEQRRRAQDSLVWGGPEIATYDRLLDTASREDDAYREMASSFKSSGMKAPRREP